MTPRDPQATPKSHEIDEESDDKEPAEDEHEEGDEDARAEKTTGKVAVQPHQQTISVGDQQEFVLVCRQAA